MNITNSQLQNASDVTIVIRSIGERTEAAGLSLAQQAVAEDNVVVLNERPFGAAVRKTFEAGIEANQPWTLAVDADVLLQAKAVGELLEWASMQSEDVFFINPTVADKALGQVRPAGVHLYRTALLPEALKHADGIDDHERPESLVRARMAMAGFPAFQLEGLVAGLHDFEQSYRDIYRKAYVHALKHPPEMMEPCLTAWRRLADADPDFRVALAGANAAQAKGGTARIDDRLFPKSIAEIEELAGLEEKAPLPANAFSAADVSRAVGEFTPFPECMPAKDMIDNARSMLGMQPTFGERLRTAYAEVGCLRFPLLACGTVLHGAGTRLVDVAKGG